MNLWALGNQKDHHTLLISFPNLLTQINEMKIFFPTESSELFASSPRTLDSELQFYVLKIEAKEVRNSQILLNLLV